MKNVIKNQKIFMKSEFYWVFISIFFAFQIFLSLFKIDIFSGIINFVFQWNYFYLINFIFSGRIFFYLINFQMNKLKLFSDSYKIKCLTLRMVDPKRDAVANRTFCHEGWKKPPSWKPFTHDVHQKWYKDPSSPFSHKKFFL